MAKAGQSTVVESLENFYKTYCEEDIAQLAQEYPRNRRSLYINWSTLNQYDPDLADDLRQQPEEVLDYAEEALLRYDYLPVDIEMDRAHVRVVNAPHSVPIRQLRYADSGQLIAVSGIIRKATDVRPKMITAAFECQRCGTLTRIPQSEGDFQEPHECQGCERQGPFRINESQSQFVDAQKLRIQERPEGLKGGEKPQSIDVYIEDDITGKVKPGDQVTVTGILNLEQQGSKQDKSRVFDFYLQGNSITLQETEFEDMDISEEEIEEIQELSNDPDLVEKMVGSIAPSIYGYRDQKRAMLLQLFAGVTKKLPDETRIRGDIHVLYVGEPGTAKSQLLQWVNNVAPRGVYTSGKGASSAGLTAAAVRDDFSDGDQWSLEAGALVLADKGLAAIDELDKMRDGDQSALHQAMEQQQVSIAKAGINSTLKTRCSMLAAANPKHGRFDHHEATADQIELEAPLISRFDLIFTIRDRPDEERDSQLARHIIHTNYAGEMDAHEKVSNGSTPATDVPEQIRQAIEPEIGLDLLRKYIAYAKRNCMPRLSEKAMDIIEEFYVDLRNEGVSEGDAVPVTARKLEAHIRLAEASARMRLSDTVTPGDAKLAESIVRTCLEDVGIDPETGEFDADVVETGTSKSQRDRIRNLKGLIIDVEDEYDTGAPLEVILERAEKVGIDREKALHELDQLKQKGELYEPETDYLRTT